MNDYFKHDLGARNNPKIVVLEQKMRGQGKAIFWDLVEMLNENDGYLPCDYRAIAYALRYCKESEVRQVVEDFSLFFVENGHFYSERVLENIAEKQCLSEVRKISGRKGGRPRKVSTDPTPATDTAGGESENQMVFEKKPNANQMVLLNKSNKINKNKSIKKDARIDARDACADADVRTREQEEDFIFVNFFFRNFFAPEREAERCLEHYAEEGIKDIAAVAKKWTPENAAQRFDDRRALEWARKLWEIISTSASRHEATDCLRAIDALNIDRGKNVLTARIRGQSWAEAVLVTVEDTQGLRDGFTEVRVTKRAGT